MQLGPTTLRWISLAVLCLCMGMPAAGDDERIRRLEEQLAEQKAMIERQQEMLEAMESELRDLKAERDSGTQVAAPPIAEEPKGPDTEVVATIEQAEEPAALLPGVIEEGSLELYGHLQLDTIYDFKRVDPDYEATLRPSTIPTVDGVFGADGNTIVSVRQTQLGFRGAATTPVGEIKTWFEFDLFGTGSSTGDTTFNLRHAWVEWGGLGFGQTNSNFMDISIFPNVIDWWGPSGMVFNRNPQLRYTWHFGDHELAGAIEKPNGSFNTGVFGDLSPEFGEAATDRTEWPDFTAHLRTTQRWGHLQLAGVYRRLAFETRGTPGNEPSDEVDGWGINFTGSVDSFGDDKIKFGLVYGEGIASFMNDGGVNLAPQNNHAAAVPIFGATLYYDRYWSEHFSTSIGASFNDADPRNQQAADEFDSGTYASVNLLYTPYPPLLIGLEFLYGRHEDVGGRSGEDYRTQASFKYKFSRGFSSQ